ncbi:MAG: exosortase/archaeosortase family protein [Phycisphaerales bacterium]|nr:MAG: exosortase/archaeosortase family protein [Phycisphaerales bacterium]
MIEASRATVDRPTREVAAEAGGAALRPVLLCLAALLALAVWSYWPVVCRLAREWRSNDDYSVGMLVPPAALYVLWLKRRSLERSRLRPFWGGLAVLALAEFARWYGLTRLFESAERYALALTVFALVLMVAGIDFVRRSLWVWAFLLLMVPLPGRVHNTIADPLQSFATSGAVFTLELLGITVERSGNTMVLNGDTPMAVAEACSGLRMLTAFVVVSSLFAFVVHRPTWHKATIVISSVPIAIACNVLRLVATAMLFLWASSATAEKFFHDFAGLVMMPAAFLMLMGELWILRRLELPAETEAQSHPLVVGG